MQIVFEMKANILAGIFQFADQERNTFRQGTPQDCSWMHSVYMELNKDYTLVSGICHHMCAAFFLKDVDHPTLDKPLSFNIPGELVSKIKPRSSNPDATVVITIPDEGAKDTRSYIEIRDADRCFEAELEPANNGDLFAKLPDTVSGVAAQFDINLLERIGKAAKILSGKRKKEFTLGHNGDAPALIDINETFCGESNFVGVVMPIRSIFPEKIPSWAYRFKERQGSLL